MGSSILHQIQSKMNKNSNPKVIQEEESRNPKEGVLPLKKRTLEMSTKYLFISNSVSTEISLSRQTFTATKKKKDPLGFGASHDLFVEITGQF